MEMGMYILQGRVWDTIPSAVQKPHRSNYMRCIPFNVTSMWILWNQLRFHLQTTECDKSWNLQSLWFRISYIPERFLSDVSLRCKAGDGPDTDLYTLVELLASHVPHAHVGYHLCLRLTNKYDIINDAHAFDGLHLLATGTITEYTWWHRNFQNQSITKYGINQSNSDFNNGPGPHNLHGKSYFNLVMLRFTLYF